MSVGVIFHGGPWNKECHLLPDPPPMYWRVPVPQEPNVKVYEGENPVDCQMKYVTYKIYEERKASFIGVLT